jgi:toxin-antitoxin system PIN domain toxin
VILPDVNVLIYAFRADSADHSRFRDWLHGVVNGPAAYGIYPLVLTSLVRICTHPRIFRNPNTLDSALHFCNALTAPRTCQIMTPGVRHWGIFEDLCRRVRAHGNLVQDAWLAAVAIEFGCEWITTDSDYSKFPGLRCRAPF